MTEPLLIVPAVITVGAALAAADPYRGRRAAVPPLGCPSATVALLVGAPLETPAASIVARVGGSGSLTALLFTGGGLGIAQAQQPSVPERVAALKASLKASQIIIKQYEWIETIVVSLKGEEKSRKEERCYYGADGKVQKIEVSASPEPKKKRGLRGKIIENKKEELSDYMKSAVALVKTYVPPNPMKIQMAKEAGNASLEVLDPGKRARINFRNYEKPGDNLGVEVDLVNNRVLGVKVATYLDDAKDAVTLDVRMGQLTDVTTYPSDNTLDGKAKKLTVNVQNSGYRKTGNQ